MKYVIKKSDNKHLLILVHGFGGSEKTWSGDQKRFIENLSEEELIQNEFNLAMFTYSTSIFGSSSLQNKLIKTAISILKNQPKEKSKGFT